jgi:hypothetical protein
MTKAIKITIGKANSQSIAFCGIPSMDRPQDSHARIASLKKQRRGKATWQCGQTARGGGQELSNLRQ